MKKKTEKAKKDAIKNAVRVSDVLVEAVNGGVQECYINQKRIEVEIRALTATIIRFAKQTDHWLAASHALNTAVKVSFFGGSCLIFSLEIKFYRYFLRY